MPARLRPPHEPTDDWQQLHLLASFPEQRTYELIRPVVLFGQSPAERAQQTGAPQRTLYRQAARFEREGMISLFGPTKVERHHRLPEEIRRHILALKAEHPPLRVYEITTICWVHFGHRPSPHPTQRYGIRCQASRGTGARCRRGSKGCCFVTSAHARCNNLRAAALAYDTTTWATRLLRGGTIHTASIERLNATFRARLAPLARRTRAAGRTVARLETAAALWAGWLVGAVYTFCPPHTRLARGQTPAMAAGMTHQVWTVAALLHDRVPPPPWHPPKRRGRRSQQRQALVARWAT